VLLGSLGAATLGLSSVVIILRNRRKRLRWHFDVPHVSFISFAVEIQPSQITKVMIVETDLQLNPKHHSGCAKLISVHT
jgi:hypothetical protein